MIPRVSSIDDAKDSAAARMQQQPRVFPFKLMKTLLLCLIMAAGFSLVSLFMTRHFAVQDVVTQARSTFQSCFGEEVDLGRWTRPPAKLMHSMTDRELFWRASFVPQAKEYPYRRVGKMAFMFLTRGPLPFAPLWERFLTGHQGLYSIYVHALPTYVANFSSSSPFYHRQIPSKVAEWGEMSMCDAERRLLANALLDLSNEWFVLVSEACVPLRNFSFIYQYFSRTSYSFIAAADELGPHGRGRYDLRMMPEVNVSVWRKGSQWFEVTREVAVTIVSDSTYYPKFEKFCRPACYVDEHYFPTMLTIETPHLLANRSVTYVDWSRGGAHPATFGKADISESFLKEILEGRTCQYNNRSTTNCFLFGRKFAPSALEPLLRLAPSVLGFG